MKTKERRGARRSAIRVLVNCLPPGTPSKRNGHLAHGWEMWACDIGDDGVGLEWSRDWASWRSQYALPGSPSAERTRRFEELPSPMEYLKKGQLIELDGLIYTEKGSKSMRGRIQWARPGKKGRTYEFGVRILSPNHRSFFRALV